MSEKLGAAKWSMGVNIALLALKAAVAFATGSVGIFAEVMHSALDLVASTIAYLGIKKASSPADETHHYGHYRFENLSSLAQVILIVITAVLVFYESAQRILEPHEVQQTALGIGVMAVSLAIAIYTARKLKAVAKKESSSALEADAYHFTTDVYSGIAVLIGLGLSHFGLPIGDPLAAIAVAVVMLYGSTELGKKAVMVLSDSAPDAKVMDAVKNALAKDKRVISYHKLRARQSGSRIFIDFHLRLEPKTRLKDAHFISHQVKKGLMALDPAIEEVHIHLEPEPKKEKVRRY